MGTVETIIVFSALMALIALVTVGIDWIGKPLKNRRFIPRIYRFADEKLPLDAYGNATLGAPGSMQRQVMHYVQPAPIVVATLPEGATPGENPAAQVAMPSPTVVPPKAAAAALHDEAPPTGRSAFSDSLAANPTETVDAVPITQANARVDLDGWLSTGPLHASAAAPSVDDPAAPTAWQVGVPLDTTVNGHKPDLATKAQRFWMATAASLERSHFDTENVERMTSGKAPRRTNARTGRIESMQLTGLRQASRPDQVQMRWPDTAVDPWNAT